MRKFIVILVLSCFSCTVKAQIISRDSAKRILVGEARYAKLVAFIEKEENDLLNGRGLYTFTVEDSVANTYCTFTSRQGMKEERFFGTVYNSQKKLLCYFYITKSKLLFPKNGTAKEFYFAFDYYNTLLAFANAQ